MTRRAPAAIAALCSLTLVVLAAGCGGGGSATNTVATGSVTCKALTGVTTFSPPLTLSGSAPEKITISLSAADCTTSDSNSAGVNGGRATATNSAATSACTSLLTSRPVEATVEWTPTTLHPSTVSFTGYAPTSSGTSSGTGFVFPDSGGKSSVTGSFTGSDSGASSKVTVFTTESEAQLLAACQSGAGLGSVPISSGGATIG